MSSAIDLGGTARSGINLSREYRRHEVRQHNYITVSVDYRRSVLWTKFARSAPAHITEAILRELLTVCQAVKGHAASPFRFRVLISERPNIFCLGGDLCHFRQCIEDQNKEELRRYAYFAIDAIWESIKGSNYEDLYSVALVQGEAQGGGFEAALSSHVLIAEKGTSFGFPESLFGLFPGMGAFDLLCARTDSQLARKIIGSARRYSAEELFQLGVIDILAEAGRGKEVVDNFIMSCSPAELTRFRGRFESISKPALLKTVDQWVDQALAISDKNLKTIGYILQAQHRAAHRNSPSAPADAKDTVMGEAS